MQLFLVHCLDMARCKVYIADLICLQVRCCGAKGSEDYTKASKEVPSECRDRVTGSEYRYGCAQQFAWWLEPWTATLAGVCTSFLLIHAIQMALISKLNKAIRQYQRAENHDYDE